MRVKEFNEEVLFATDEIVKLGHADIEFLKQRAATNRRKRIRLCTHKHVDDLVHEMLIIHTRDTFVRPHKHLNKSESFHVIEGSVDIVIFAEAGDVVDVIQMGDFSSEFLFYYRVDYPYYHTLLIRSDVLVFHEATKGPFLRSDTIFAPWAPEETDTDAIQSFVEKLAQAVDSFISSRNKGT